VRSLFAALATGPDRPVTASDEEVDRLYRRHRLRIMLAITIGYAIAYTCRLALSVVKKPLLDEGIFTAAELGLIGSGLFYTYAFGKLVNGFLADHANLRFFFALGVFVSALLNVGMGFSTVLGLSVLLWSLNGWFQGFGAPSGVVAMANWFTSEERGRRYGIWSTAHSLGEGFTFIGVAGLVTLFGWRAGFWGPGAICILVAVAMIWLVQDRPETLGLPPVHRWRALRKGVALEAAEAAAAAPNAGGKSTSTWSEQRTIFRRPAIWILALSSAMIYVTRYAVNSWGVLFLQEERGLSLMQAGSVISVNTLSGILGAVSYGFLSDKLFGGRRPPANLLFATLELAGLGMIFLVPSSSIAFLTAGFFVFGFGLTGLVSSLGGLFAVDIVSKRAAGAVMGLVGVFSYLAAAIQENVSGVLIDRGTTLVDGVRHYDFDAPIAFWIGCSCVSAALSATLWRVRARN
jgi:OPA family sugar phosphate sensor protein UhpC-like MFS transporter